MYVSSFEMIKAAREGRYAVPAFNAENMEMVQAIVSAAESVRSPVMIQTTMPTVKYIGEDMAVAMVKTVAERATVPVALHLDHCTSFDAVMRALWAGYTSVMFDGSKMPFEENVALTRKVVDAARPMGVTVEAELGTVGGKEDNVSASIIYTEPEEAEEFVERTGVDILAIAIGTAHGFYKGEPKLDFDHATGSSRRLGHPDRERQARHLARYEQGQLRDRTARRDDRSGQDGARRRGDHRPEEIHGTGPRRGRRVVP